MKVDVIYGCKDQGRSIGVVHLFLSDADRDSRRPLCGRRQPYIPAGADEGPKCKTCLMLIGRQ